MRQFHDGKRQNRRHSSSQRRLHRSPTVTIEISPALCTEGVCGGAVSATVSNEPAAAGVTVAPVKVYF